MVYNFYIVISPLCLDILLYNFSLNQPNQLFIVEKVGVAGGESSVDLSNYEYRNKVSLFMVAIVLIHYHC